MPNQGQFDFTPGGNQMADVKVALNSIMANTLINPAITGSLTTSGSLTVTGSINSTGSIVMSGTASINLTGSFNYTGSLTTNGITITQIVGAALPSSSAAGPAPATGSLFVSGSGANCKLYFWNGTFYSTASMSQI